MKKTRTLKDGQAVTIHNNDGIRKRCRCQRRAWSSCPHPWAFSFKVKGSKAERFLLSKYADHPITSRADALAERDRLRILIRNGQPLAPTPATPATPADLTFETFAEKWRTTARVAMPDTLKDNDAAIRKRLGDLVVDGERLATRLIGMTTEDTIEGAFNQLQSLAGSTWNKYRDAVRLMQRWGVKKGYLLRPWVSDDNETIVHKPTAKRERRLVPDGTDDQGQVKLDERGQVKAPGEERRLLDKAGAWLQRLIIAALESGCRRGELLSFTWGDVSLHRGVLSVRAENAKSGKARDIPISPRLRGVLQMIEHDPAGNPHKPTAFVFGDKIGGQVKDPKKAWAKCCKLAGITGLHFHDLRHEAGSRMLEAGWPLHHVQAVLGHADAKTTSGYLNATLQYLLDSMRRYGTERREQPLHTVAHGAIVEPPPLGNAHVVN
jgi:integrase